MTKPQCPAARPLAFAVAMLLLTGLLGACNYVRPAVTQQSEIVTDAMVDRSNLRIYVRPADKLHAPIKALMYPMWIRESLPARIEMGRNMARIFFDAWTERPVFPALMLAENQTYRGKNSALANARQRGADMLVLLTVPYLYAGGTVDDSAITIRCDIYNVEDGLLLHSMEQSGRLAFQRNKDWILWVTTTRLPDSPLYAITRAIAEDMAVPLRSWLPPVDARRLGYAYTSEEIVNGLTSSPDATESGSQDDLKNAVPGPDAVPSTDLEPESALRRLDLAQELTGPEAGSVYIKVEFDVDKATIRPEYHLNLDELAKALQSPPLQGRRVLLIGHTDSDASETYNLDLSRRRAQAVRDYLVQRHGLDPNLLRTDGRGESAPLVPNTSPENKQLNRRVEVRLAADQG
jgi:OOP family OmpA-OmpF porin